MGGRLPPIYEKNLAIPKKESFDSLPLYFVPAESMGEKGIDGRILLFSTTLVNRH
jgi:hypothetical protein